MTISEAQELVSKLTTSYEYRDVVFYNDALKLVEQIVNEMQAEMDKLLVEKSKYEAKIFAYEAILQNSNFKMAVVRKKEEK